MAFPATTPTLSVAATALLGNNAGTAGLPNSNNFDRLTYAEAILGNLLTDAPATMSVSNVALISLSSSTGIGYGTGAGSSTTQITGKTTAFTCNTVTGRITFNNSALAGSSTTSSAIWNCSAITSTNNVVVFNHISGGTIGPYTFQASCTSSSSAVIFITNNSTQSLSEAPVLNYAILRTAVA